MAKKKQHEENYSTLIAPLVSQQTLQDERREEGRQRMKVAIFITACFVLSISLGGFSYYEIKENVIRKAREQEESEMSEEEEEENVQFDPIDKLAYVSYNNVWVVDLDGKGVLQLTNDGTDEKRYSSLAWKNKEELSFSQCVLQKCRIETYHFAEDVIYLEHEFDAEEVVSMRWSHKGDSLTYVYNSNDKLFLNVKVSENAETIKEFLGMNMSFSDFNDALYLRFSPDDEMIMLVNTYVDINSPSILIVKTHGEEVMSLNRTDEVLPTFGFFMSNEIIYYKKDQYMYIKTIGKEDETQMSDSVIDVFNIQPSPNRAKLAYWTYDWNGGITTIWVYEIGLGFVRRLQDQESFPLWHDKDRLISLSTPNCYQCSLDKLAFEGFDLVDVSQKTLSTLVNVSDISSFTADNL